MCEVRGSGSWNFNTGLWEMSFLMSWNAVAVAHETCEGGHELKSNLSKYTRETISFIDHLSIAKKHHTPKHQPKKSAYFLPISAFNHPGIAGGPSHPSKYDSFGTRLPAGLA